MIKTIVPTGANVTPALLLGWPSAVCLGAELECVAVAFADDAGDDDEDEAEDDDAPVLADDAAVLWVAVPVGAPAAELELDDPPHAVSSSTSEPSPAAAVHRLPRIRLS